MANLGERHYEAMKCILKYSRRIKYLYVVYQGVEPCGFEDFFQP